MSTHWVIHTTGLWKQEITPDEARGMIKRATGGGGVVCRALRHGGIIFTSQIIGVEKITDEDRYELLKREDPHFNYLDLEEPVPVIEDKDETTELVQEWSGEPEQVPAGSDYGNELKKEKEEEEEKEDEESPMTNAEFKAIFELQGLSQNEFAKRIGMSQAMVRLYLKEDQPVSEAAAAKVKEAFG